MRYLTHEFAHVETLERARRWLVQAGFESSQIEAVCEGIPRISVRVEPGQAAEAGLIISAAERGDPEGLPGFWDLARLEHGHPHHAVHPVQEPSDPSEPRTFVVGFHLPDERPDLLTSVTAVAMREAYVDRPIP
ncbi:MAG: hypothetical protein U0790_11480 [Isosphaeraceae bacterium]